MTGWQSFENARSSIESITIERLTSIRDAKKRQIESYFDQIRRQVIALSEDPMVADAARAFLYTNSEHSVHPPSSDGKAFSTYQTGLRNYCNRFGFDDLLLIAAGSGRVLFAASRGISSQAESGGNLASLFIQLNGLSRSDTSVLVDFRTDPGSGAAPVAMIGSPVVSDGIVVAHLVFKIPISGINSVMTSDNNWKAEGLGETGETYLVGSDYTMRTDSRFFIQDSALYFARLRKIGTSEDRISEIRMRRTSILLQNAATDAAIDALHGVTNTRIINDYRGISVLSSYAPLRIPGVNWAILSEIDTAEAFSQVTLLKERLILIGLVIVFLAAVAGMLIARTISRPILRLSMATERIGQGDLVYRTDVSANDEIGQLAAAFNVMADRIAGNTAQLQAEVAERRRAEEEVVRSHTRLRDLSAHLQSVREEERKGLAREIHDELGQALTALKLNLTLLRRGEGVDPAIAEKIDAMLGMIDTTIRSVKRIMTTLRPRLLDDLGLTAAIEWQAGEFQERTGIPCRVEIEPGDITIDADRSTALFRIFQETLTNITRHANASSVDVSLTSAGGGIELIVMDDGVGIRESHVSNRKSFGLIGIRERAAYWGGTAEFRAGERGGTTVVVRLPLKEGYPHD